MARPLLFTTAVAVGLIALGCGREASFPDRTARVTLDGGTTTFTVDACLLDGQTAYVVGRSDDGRVVQTVVGVEADGETGVPASTGLTMTTGDDAGVAAFGEEAWARREGSGDPPGTITSARIRGARIQAHGRAQLVDSSDRPQPGPEVDVSFDARCDEPDGS